MAVQNMKLGLSDSSSTGSAGTPTDNHAYFLKVTTPNELIVARTMKIWIDTPYQCNFDLKPVIWNEDYSVLAVGTARNFQDDPNIPSWEEFSFTTPKPVLKPNTVYYIGFVCNDNGTASIAMYVISGAQVSYGSGYETDNNYSNPTAIDSPTVSDDNYLWYIEYDQIRVHKFCEKDIEDYAKIMETDPCDFKRIFGLNRAQFDRCARGLFMGGHTGAARVDTIEYVQIRNTGNGTDFGDLTETPSGPVALSNGLLDRAVRAGGHNGSQRTNVMDYVTISVLGNATDFGDRTEEKNSLGSCSNGSSDRGCFFGGATATNTIDYITISTTGNAANFGDIKQAVLDVTGTDNGTNDRGVRTGGYLGSSVYSQQICYWTISSAADSTDFGDLQAATSRQGACSNKTNNRAVVGGGRTSGSTYINRMDYFNISSTSNATDFGNLTTARSYPGAVSNGIGNRGLWAGGDTGSTSDIIDYVTINSAGNATDFGDLTAARKGVAATSDAG